MIDLGPVSEVDFVLAFVRAEIDAPRYRDAYRLCLNHLGRSRTQLIDTPDLGAESDNFDRAQLLGCVRGYRPDVGLFQRFPEDVVWRSCQVDSNEVGQFLYANFPVLIEVSGPGRVVSDGAQRLKSTFHEFSTETQQFVDGVRAVAKRVDAGEHFEPLIVLTDGISPRVVLLEGHTRATAYTMVGKPTELNVLLGTSPLMQEWWLF